MTTDFDLTGELALVTGSGSGIGLGIAHALAQAGAWVLLHGRDRGKLEVAAGQFAPDRVAGCACFDIADESSVAEGFGELADTGHMISILVNNAGSQLRQSLLDMDPADWRRIIDINLTGAFLVSRHVVPGMRQRGRGKIVNITSLTAEVARPDVGPYTAAKGGLRMLTRAMAVEWAPFGIQVNAIGPGHIVTEMTAATRAQPDFEAWARHRTPAGRWGEVRDLGGVAVFLASRASDFVTGQTLYVDGGFLAAM
ncbi:SDR family oxidoreductase [Paracoccus onubensis]|uniref:SDR family oxidoreductase n=1 Tax=Paracoccus onubensis TaxID=1675788 RepID=A0A418T3T2_9RHOB|nr:SDR family oxidoreductase [Paracoccus onubensis]RJE87862.1 SDR family oxidoreductase [Paracoccus onubensis]